MPEMIDKAEALKHTDFDYDERFRIVHEWLLTAPTIEAEPVRHGRWIVHTTWHGMFGLIHSECSECKFDRNGDLSSWKLCPQCGARMDLRTPTEVALDIADSVMMGGSYNDSE